ncbi:MAG: antitoxin [Candidatus Pacebacteria bacterium]|nr:antitoxin [Candidatus Paceibacterota bacterium]
MNKTNPFYNLQLDPEEQAIEDALERGEYVSVKNLAEEKKKLAQVAKNTLGKAKNINIRVSEKTVLKLKAIAIQEGLPYQTLASSVLHKFANQQQNRLSV